jgi:hypothetical protein
MTDEPIEPREPMSGGAGSSPDLAAEWRRVGEALGQLGGGIGDSVRTAWESSGSDDEAEAEPPSQGMRRVADAFDRGVDSARRAASSPEARERVNADARRAGSQLERAMRLSIAELGRTLQRVAPEDRAAGAGTASTMPPETPGPLPTEGESAATDDPSDRI